MNERIMTVGGGKEKGNDYYAFRLSRNELLSELSCVNSVLNICTRVVPPSYKIGTQNEQAAFHPIEGIIRFSIE